jgi:hypothetical protein
MNAASLCASAGRSTPGVQTVHASLAFLQRHAEQYAHRSVFHFGNHLKRLASVLHSGSRRYFANRAGTQCGVYLSPDWTCLVFTFVRKSLRLQCYLSFVPTVKRSSACVQREPNRRRRRRVRSRKRSRLSRGLVLVCRLRGFGFAVGIGEAVDQMGWACRAGLSERGPVRFRDGGVRSDGPQSLLLQPATWAET